jgi:hypothetical protein
MSARAKASTAGSNLRPGRRTALIVAIALFASLVLGVSLAAAVAPVATVENASGVDATSAHVEGEVDPQGKETSWRFEYITDAKFQENLANTLPGFEGASSGPQGSLEAAAPATAVEGELKGLQPNTTYHLRLFAENEDGPTEDVAANFATDEIAPTLSKPLHHQLGEGEVAIAGYANPHNSAVSNCHFDYGPTASYGQSVACEPTPPTDNQANLVRAELSLTPGATYHFRFSVTNGAGTSESADATFVPRKAPAEGACANAGFIGVGFLPGCRAWEMVSPPDKNGGSVMRDSSRIRAASDGSAVGFGSLQGFAGVLGAGIVFEYIAQRSTDPDPGHNGWSTHASLRSRSRGPFSAPLAQMNPTTPESSRLTSPKLYSGPGAR